MKYLSLFSGIGGFEVGIEEAYGYYRQHLRNRPENVRAYLSYSEESPVWPTCIGFSEIDKYAVQIYQRHFPEHKNYGDIKLIKAEELPEFDLLVGGFPCQSFSIAGKRGGFNDTRGTLFFDIARILKVRQPRLLLLENVKGLLSHDEGRTFATIISTLDELGYDLQWQVLNSKNFGVPQNRERVFIVGHLRGTSRPQVFPIGQADDTTDEGHSQNPPSRETSQTIRSRYGNGTGSHIGIVKVSGDLDKRKTYLGDIASTLASNPTSDNTARLFEDGKIRRLTPTECERLQGFPDGWTAEVSDTQRYKTLGNAVTTNVVAAIMEKLL